MSAPEGEKEGGENIMSGDGDLWEKVQGINAEQRVLRRDVDQLTNDVGEIKTGMEDVSRGVNEILARERASPPGTTLRMIAATAAGVAIAGALITVANFWFDAKVTWQTAGIAQDVKRNTEFVNRWKKEGRLLLLERRLKERAQPVMLNVPGSFEPAALHAPLQWSAWRTVTAREPTKKQPP